MTCFVACLLIQLVSFQHYSTGQQKQKSPHSQFVTSEDGITIAYQVYGELTPTLVFVHGWCCDKSYWAEQIDFFKEDFRLALVDLAGHGESGLGRTEYTIQRFAKNITAVIKAVELDSFIILGHSLGGSVAVETAQMNPRKTKAVFLIDSFKDFPESITEEKLVAIRDNWAGDWNEGNFQTKCYNWIKVWYFPEEDSALREKIGRDMSSAPPEVGVNTLINLVVYNNRDLPESLKKLDGIPVLSINAWNGQDLNKLRRWGVNFKQVIALDSVSHFLMMSPANEFNRILREQIGTLP